MTRSAQIKAGVSLSGLQQADQFLAALPLVARTPEVQKAVRKGLNEVAKRAEELAPVGGKGYPRRRPENKPLKDTIGVVVREYGNVLVGVVGPQYPAGAHGHLLEHGHRVARGGTLSPLSSAKNKIAPKSKRGGEFRGKGMATGMAEAFPFMQPAWEDKKDSIEPTIVGALQTAAEKLAAQNTRTSS